MSRTDGGGTGQKEKSKSAGRRGSAVEAEASGGGLGKTRAEVVPRLKIVNESRTHGRAACALARLAVRPWIPPFRPPDPWRRSCDLRRGRGVSFSIRHKNYQKSSASSLALYKVYTAHRPRLSLCQHAPRSGNTPTNSEQAFGKPTGPVRP